jgi:hypothetical protein
MLRATAITPRRNQNENSADRQLERTYITNVSRLYPYQRKVTRIRPTIPVVSQQIHREVGCRLLAMKRHRPNELEVRAVLATLANQRTSITEVAQQSSGARRRPALLALARTTR